VAYPGFARRRLGGIDYQTDWFSGSASGSLTRPPANAPLRHYPGLISLLLTGLGGEYSVRCIGRRDGSAAAEARGINPQGRVLWHKKSPETGMRRNSELLCDWWAKRGSNPRHHPCKGCALPAELFARTPEVIPQLYATILLTEYTTTVPGCQDF
jgi:hypothetical protein